MKKAVVRIRAAAFVFFCREELEQVEGRQVVRSYVFCSIVTRLSFSEGLGAVFLRSAPV